MEFAADNRHQFNETTGQSASDREATGNNQPASDGYGEEAGEIEEAPQLTPDEGKGYVDEFSADFVNAEIFRVLDFESTGKITLAQLHNCAKAMGWGSLQCKFNLRTDCLSGRAIGLTGPEP